MYTLAREGTHPGETRSHLTSAGCWEAATTVQASESSSRPDDAKRVSNR
ncbi:MAG: hypothetical protein KME25_30825 [Symplocastrum torsivum CPER-KK1]|uniref:Uncharacterized protein n=1 Tax=Symplocastrum torsivum CPER-KK1 TaxID=450513 RepID=A0A951PS48_9CYAN|nr:hypothetical protein [Symplocastrum torsivum CPER-KK1]